MEKSTTTKAKSKAGKKPAESHVDQARRNLDAARSKNDPDPDRVLVAILGWWASIEYEVQQVGKLLRKFQRQGSIDFRPGFEFLHDVRSELDTVAEALQTGRPIPSGRPLKDLVEEVNMMLPSPDRDEKYRDRAKKGGA